MKLFSTIALWCCLLVSYSQDSLKTYRFIFRAGAAAGLNFYEPGTVLGIREYSYDKVSIGTGLGTELSYKAVKFMDVTAHYYFYVYKNEVDFPAYLIHEFGLKQQNHLLAVSADFKLYSNKKTKISIGTGPGISLNKEQFLQEDATTGAVLHVGERNNVRFIAPVYVGMDTYVKDYIVLGVRVQTFIWGDQHPFRTLNLFTYLGMRF